MIHSWLIIVSIVALLLLCLKIWWSGRHLRALALKMPGPPTLPLIGNANLALFSADKIVAMARILVNLHQNKPFRVWMGPKLFVFIIKPEDVETFLIKYPILCKDSQLDKTIGKFIHFGYLRCVEAKWKKIQTAVDYVNEINIVETCVNAFNNHSNTCVSKLRMHADGSVFDPYSIIGHYTLDVVCESILGVSCNAQKNPESTTVKSAMESSLLTSERCARSLILFDYLYYSTFTGIEHKNAEKIFRKFVEGVVTSRIGKVSEDKQAFLDLFIRFSTQSLDKVIDEICAIIKTGQDVTAISICFTLVMLGLKPKLQEQIVEELKKIFKDDWKRSVTTQDLQEMHHLDKFIKETLRLFPPVAYIPRRVEEDVPLSSCVVPKGCDAAVLNYFTHRDPEHYSDPERFDPERFNPEHSSGRLLFSYIPFGVGPLSLVLMEYAEIHMKTVLSTLLRSYEIMDAVTYDSLRDLRLGFILKPAQGFKIKIVPRQMKSGDL